MEKKVNLFNGSQWRDAKIAELTKNAIQQKNEAFVQQHRADTNRDLLQYLWRCARTLGRSPSDTEVIGADLLIERFGSWERALEMAKLRKRRSPVPLERSWIYRKEFAYQTEVFQQAREAEKEKRRAANEAVRQENAARLERDALWGEEHKDWTDEELLAYLRTCAETLGHTPYAHEVLGGSYISQRIGSWGMVLYRAGLPALNGTQLRETEKKLLREEERQREAAAQEEETCREKSVGA